MTNSLFRKSTLDRVSSPEQLTDYIRVATPGVWVFVLTLVVVIGTLLVWGFAGRLITTVDGDAVMENGQAVCYLSVSDAERVKPGMTAVVDSDSKATVQSADYVSDGAHTGEVRVVLALEGSTPQTASFPLSVVVESVRPIDFLLNQ